jgi:pimeloyl-ACP methyl ester carboxylesterase
VIAPLAKLIDWSALQAATMWIPLADEQNPRLEEALKFLAGPEFIADENRPAQVEFGPDKSNVHFRFPTPRPGGSTENNTVYGRLYRCAGCWQERPVIILLHGNSDSITYQFRYPRLARKCNREGFNAATLVAPNHFQRCPHGGGRRTDCLQTAESAAQAVAEIRAFTGWLLGEGCPAVALWGISMGAWYAGMAACRDARLNSVVMTVPGVRMNGIERLALRPGVRRRYAIVRELCERLNVTALNLANIQPVIPKDNILLIEGIYDLFAPRENVEDLWQAWGQPNIWRLPHGHVSISTLGSPPGLTERVLRWLSPRLNNSALTQKS